MPLLWLSLAFVCGIVLGEGWQIRLMVWLALAGLCVTGLLARQWLKRRWARRLPQGAAQVGWFDSIRPHFQVPRRLVWLAGLWHSIHSQFPPLGLPVLAFWLVFFLGAARLQWAQPHIDAAHLAFYVDQDERYVIEGLVVEPPDQRDGYMLVKLQADHLHPASSLQFLPVQGELQARLPPDRGLRYGDRLRLTGWLTTPSESEAFSYRRYLARRSIYAVFACGSQYDERCAVTLGHDQGSFLLALIYTLRTRASALIARLLPDPQAALLQGILLGIESGIPAGVQTAFQLTGAAHIIAISGFNFAVVAKLFTAVFSKLFGRWWGMLVAFLGIALYALLAGAGAGVIRAAIMGSLGVFAQQIGRRQHGLNSLAFVAAVMALHDPYVLWDVSFQLSFAATLGLVLYADPLSNAFINAMSHYGQPDLARRLAGPVGEYFLFTLAAQLTTLPLMLYYFRRLSLISLVTNPLVLPPQPAVMFLGGATVLLGLIWEPLGQLVAYLTWPLLVYTIQVVELMARAPLASVVIAPLEVWMLVLFYSGLFGWTAFGARLRAWWAARWGADPLAGAWQRLAWPALVGLSLATGLVWQQVLAAPDGRLHLTVLDVSTGASSGDALLIRTPQGRAVLVDGGPSASALSDGLGRRLPLGSRELDALVIAAANDQQLAALPDVIERYPPARVLWSGSTVGSYSARLLRQGLNQNRIPVDLAQPGMALDLGQGAWLRVLAVERRGAVLLLEWQRFRLLLPIGLDFDSLEALMGADGSATPGNPPLHGPLTGLLLAEGGYAPLNPPEWIAHWRPQVVLLSVSPGDANSQLEPGLAQALAGYTLLRTDRNGWIELSTDGENLWVEVEKP